MMPTSLARSKATSSGTGNFGLRISKSLPRQGSCFCSDWSRAKKRTPRPRSRAAPGGYKKSSAFSSTSPRPPRNRKTPKPRLGSGFGQPPLDPSEELAVAGGYSSAEGQLFLAGTVDQVFVEVPPGALASFRGKRCVQGVGAARRHAGFREHRKAHTVVHLAKFGDVAVAARFLAAEIVGGKAQYDKALLAVAAVQRLQSLVLGCVPALTRGIHHQQHLALELAQRRCLVGQARQGVVVQRRARGEGGRGDRSREQQSEKNTHRRGPRGVGRHKFPPPGRLVE